MASGPSSTPFMRNPGPSGSAPSIQTDCTRKSCGGAESRSGGGARASTHCPNWKMHNGRGVQSRPPSSGEARALLSSGLPGDQVIARSCCDLTGRGRKARSLRMPGRRRPRTLTAARPCGAGARHAPGRNCSGVLGGVSIGGSRRWLHRGGRRSLGGLLRGLARRQPRQLLGRHVLRLGADREPRHGSNFSWGSGILCSPAL
jgi:hypothetical protein